MKCEDTHSPLWSFEGVCLSPGGGGDSERLLYYSAWYYFFPRERKTMLFFFLHVTSSSKCVMSFGEQMFGAHTHTHTFFFLSWMTLKWTWLKEKGESAGKTCRHGIRRQRRPLFMSRLQHSGETLEQWKYIESGRLLFSLGRTIIFGWLRTRVHI